MKFIEKNGQKIAVTPLDTLVIGSGCAGFNATDTLYDLGRTDIAILTEGINMGTSRNTGSDKQTYYKLSLCSDKADSIYELAENLFAGGSVNGDTALAEAAGSLRSFMKLVNLGVPFPTNPYGEYVGYKTDHDPRQRATSCGPLTSKIITEKLENSVKRKNIRIYDQMQAIRLITADGALKGVIAIDLNRLSENDYGLTVFLCNQLIMATGGPAIAYAASVYPESQTGMTGMALETGAVGCNLQEWQYGLASVKFRWNVSGTYQQVLPRYIAVDKDGHEREFLPEYFDKPAQALDMIFLKGYQWPFDTAKIAGSSIIDIIVHHEIFHKGNRVYLDFRTDPQGLENGFDDLSAETYHYLDRSGALQKTPIARLAQMNPKAIDLYAAHGVDLWREPLEIAVCAQHNNGGIAVDMNWESSIKGLFVAGEAAGTFGISRPGGSALNSTQVGSQRAAEQIAFSPKKTPAADELDAIFSAADAPDEISSANDALDAISSVAVAQLLTEIDLLLSGGTKEITACRHQAQEAMSLHAANIRSAADMQELTPRLTDSLRNFFTEISLHSALELPYAYKTRDMLLTQCAMLSAMSLTGDACHSRGSALLADSTGNPIAMDGLKHESKLDAYRYLPGNNSHRNDWVSTIWQSDGTFSSEFVPVRPLPRTDDWFEQVWNDYNTRRMI